MNNNITETSAAVTEYRFTTRAMILPDGKRFKVQYSLDTDGTLDITGKLENGKDFMISLQPDSRHYSAARAAYDEKAAKRAAYEASRPATPEKYFAGMEIKGPDWTIKMDASIDRATVTFKRKPAAEIREMVKAAGFWWSPNHKQWCRRMTGKAWKAAQELAIQLKGGKPADSPETQRPEIISA